MEHENLKSEKVRKLAPEMDPLRLGMGWKSEDLDKPKILIESTFGDSHPGSSGLLPLVDKAAAGVHEAGGKAARYFVTDICDGQAQGHDGINYSLASRDMICNMVEIHNNATPFDAGVFVASCDKGLPGLLMGIGRTNLPSVVLTGGVSHDPRFVSYVTERVGWIAPVKVYAGDFEMDALASGAIRALEGTEDVMTYTGEPSWTGFAMEGAIADVEG